MAATVLNSARAIEVSVYVVRAFDMATTCIASRTGRRGYLAKPTLSERSPGWPELSQACRSGQRCRKPHLNVRFVLK